MDMEPRIKKRKSCVFSVEDQIKLLELIEKEKGIVENKTTNKVSNEEKDLAWDRIASRYNAIALQHRSIDQLKSKFDNLKTKARKVVAEQRNYVKGTGGGPPASHKFDILIEMVLRIINYKTVVGFENPFDCDDDDSGTGDTESDNIVANIDPAINCSIADLDVFLSTDDPVIINIPPQSSINLAAGTSEEQKDMGVGSDAPEKYKDNFVEPSGSNSVKVHTPTQSKWSNYTPRKLKESVSKKLRPTVINPVIEAKEKYYRMRTLDLEEQIRIRKAEDRRQEEKHKKEMALIDLDIKLKEKQLSDR